MEKMRATEAVAARDVIAQHLSLACKSIRDKSAVIDTLRQQNKYLEDILKEHTLAHASATLTLTSRSEQPPPACRESPCVKTVDEDSKEESSSLKEPPLANIVAEEEPPKYEVTDVLPQVR